MSQPRLRVLPAREDEWLLVGRSEREERALPDAQRQLAGDVVIFDPLHLRAPGAERHRIGAEACDDPISAALDPGAPAPEAEARLHSPAELDGPGKGFDLPDQLTKRRQGIPGGERHRIGGAHAARWGAKGRLEDVAPLFVTTLHLERLDRRELEAPTSVRVEHARERRGRVDVRQTQPVDRAIPAHECDRPPVADGRVIANRKEAVFSQRHNDDRKCEVA
jgi:hypothetical protein